MTFGKSMFLDLANFLISTTPPSPPSTSSTPSADGVTRVDDLIDELVLNIDASGAATLLKPWITLKTLVEIGKSNKYLNFSY